MTSGGKAGKVLAGCVQYQVKANPKEISIFNPGHSVWRHENETEKMVVLLSTLHLYVDIIASQDFNALVEDIFSIFSKHYDLNVQQHIPLSYSPIKTTKSC